MNYFNYLSKPTSGYNTEGDVPKPARASGSRLRPYILHTRSD